MTKEIDFAAHFAQEVLAPPPNGGASAASSSSAPPEPKRARLGTDTPSYVVADASSVDQLLTLRDGVRICVVCGINGSGARSLCAALRGYAERHDFSVNCLDSDSLNEQIYGTDCEVCQANLRAHADVSAQWENLCFEHPNGD